MLINKQKLSADLKASFLMFFIIQEGQRSIWKEKQHCTTHM